MDDLISRQAALDALGEEPKVWDERVDDYAIGEREQWRSDRLSIEALPSAQPEIIYCKDCKHAHLGSWYCGMWNNSPGFPIVKEDGFCWMAERKEE